MTSLDDYLQMLQTDCSLLAVELRANDPRTFPTEVITLVLEDDSSLAEVEAFAGALAQDYQWGNGHLMHVRKSAGGIGADGASVTELVLGIITAIPTVRDLLTRLKAGAPSCPSKEDAWQRATMAVAVAYETVPRRELRVVSERQHTDHWTFQMVLPGTDDRFEVEVYGESSGPTVGTRVTWANGDAWGDRAPGSARVTAPRAVGPPRRPGVA